MGKKDANSISNEKENDEMQWGKYYIIVELINIATTINIIGHESLVDDVLKSGVRYYMVMLTKFAIVNQEVEAKIALWL